MTATADEQNRTPSATSGAVPVRLDLSDEELAALVQGSPHLDPHSKRYWLALFSHLSPEHRRDLAAALLKASGSGPGSPQPAHDDAPSRPAGKPPRRR